MVWFGKNQKLDSFVSALVENLNKIFININEDLFLQNVFVVAMNKNKDTTNRYSFILFPGSWDKKDFILVKTREEVDSIKEFVMDFVEIKKNGFNTILKVENGYGFLRPENFYFSEGSENIGNYKISFQKGLKKYLENELDKLRSFLSRPGN